MKVGNFNIQNLSSKKLTNDFVLKSLINIISDYDVLFIVELCDIEAIDTLCKELNKSNNNKYKYGCSKKTGKTACTAEYIGFIYSNNVTFNNQLDYHTINNLSFDFTRDPLLLNFTISNNQYIFIVSHICPTNVFNELNYMNIISNELYDKLNHTKIVILGDFNADGSYLSNKNENINNLFTNEKLICLTNNEITSLGKKGKKYDRILCSKECISYLNKVDNDIGNECYCDVDNYNEKLSLTKEQCKKISDHFPIYINIK